MSVDYMTTLVGSGRQGGAAGHLMMSTVQITLIYKAEIRGKDKVTQSSQHEDFTQLSCPTAGLTARLCTGE